MCMVSPLQQENLLDFSNKCVTKLPVISCIPFGIIVMICWLLCFRIYNSKPMLSNFVSRNWSSYFANWRSPGRSWGRRFCNHTTQVHIFYEICLPKQYCSLWLIRTFYGKPGSSLNTLSDVVLFPLLKTCDILYGWRRKDNFFNCFPPTHWGHK